MAAFMESASRRMGRRKEPEPKRTQFKSFIDADAAAKTAKERAAESPEETQRKAKERAALLEPAFKKLTLEATPCKGDESITAEQSRRTFEDMKMAQYEATVETDPEYYAKAARLSEGVLTQGEAGLRVEKRVFITIHLRNSLPNSSELQARGEYGMKNLHLLTQLLKRRRPRFPLRQSMHLVRKCKDVPSAATE